MQYLIAFVYSSALIGDMTVEGYINALNQHPD